MSVYPNKIDIDVYSIRNLKNEQLMNVHNFYHKYANTIYY